MNKSDWGNWEIGWEAHVQSNVYITCSYYSPYLNELPELAVVAVGLGIYVAVDKNDDTPNSP